MMGAVTTLAVTFSATGGGSPTDAALTVPIWGWLLLIVAIAGMLGVDLALHHGSHVIGFREALAWSAVWITVGLGFGVLLWWWSGSETAELYFTGYLIEKALSIDNLFVMAMVFAAFAVPAAYQHKVLFWGVIGALAFRLAFIFAGVGMLETFFWTAYLFGAFLIFTAYRMVVAHDKEVHPEQNPLVRLARRAIPTVPRFDGDRFITTVDGRRVATLLFLVLVAVEATDLLFAIDSVAAVLAITTNTFIVWSANAFAILGLRSLYFCLAGLLRRFRYLHYGLALLLAFAGVKLILSQTPVGKLPIGLTLGVIVLTIAVSIGWSLVATRGPSHPTKE